MQGYESVMGCKKKTGKIIAGCCFLSLLVLPVVASGITFKGDGPGLNKAGFTPSLQDLARGGNGNRGTNGNGAENGGYGPGDGTGNSGDGPHDGTGYGPGTGDCQIVS